MDQRTAILWAIHMWSCRIYYSLLRGKCDDTEKEIFSERAAGMLDYILDGDNKEGLDDIIDRLTLIIDCI